MINYLLFSILLYQISPQKGMTINNTKAMNHILLLKNHTRTKRYGFENDNKWRQEIRQKEQDVVINFFRFQNASQEEKKKYYYYRTPRVMRQTWIYEHYGRLSGFTLAIIMAAVHHILALLYAIVVWIYRRMKDGKNAQALLPPKKNRHYEELERLPDDIVKELLEITQSQTRETFLDDGEKEFEKFLIRVNPQKEKTEDTGVDDTPVIGILPFHKIGIPGPYGERIIEKSKPLRDPMPGEQPPIIFDIDDIPQYLIDQKSGFLELVKLAQANTVIVKTDRTADGHLKGYFDGRFIEDKTNKDET